MLQTRPWIGPLVANFHLGWAPAWRQLNHSSTSSVHLSTLNYWCLSFEHPWVLVQVNMVNVFETKRLPIAVLSYMYGIKSWTFTSCLDAEVAIWLVYWVTILCDKHTCTVPWSSRTSRILHTHLQSHWLGRSWTGSHWWNKGMSQLLPQTALKRKRGEHFPDEGENFCKVQCCGLFTKVFSAKFVGVASFGGTSEQLAKVFCYNYRKIYYE